MSFDQPACVGVKWYSWRCKIYRHFPLLDLERLRSLRRYTLGHTKFCTSSQASWRVACRLLEDAAMAMASRIEFLLPKKLLVSSRYNIEAVLVKGSAYIVIVSFSSSFSPCILVVSLAGTMVFTCFCWLYCLALAEAYVITQDSKTSAGPLQYGDHPQLRDLSIASRARMTRSTTLETGGLIQKRATERLDLKIKKKVPDVTAGAGG